MGNLRIGTSGWQYRHWRGDFYPADMTVKEWFAHYAAAFDTVEVNNTFYRLPPSEVFDQWRQRALEGFCYAVKYSRFGTHMKRLADPASHVKLFMDRAILLGEFLGPVLVQLPPQMGADGRRLDEFLVAAGQWAKSNRAIIRRRLCGSRPAGGDEDKRERDARVTRRRDACDTRGQDARTTRRRDACGTHGQDARDTAIRWVVEFRNAGWLCQEVYDILARHRAALCIHDNLPDHPRILTAGFAYIRYHGTTAHGAGSYSGRQLAAESDRICNWLSEGIDVYAYFNNDAHGHAIRNAQTLGQMIAQNIHAPV